MNSVKTTTLQVCKIIEGSELRSDVSEVLTQLAAVGLRGKIPIGGLFHFGRQRHRQFLGYLEGHFQRQKFMDGHLPYLIQSLPDDQLGVLATAHALLHGIVENVASDVFKGRPDLGSTASPYYGADPSWWAAARPADQPLGEATRALVEAIVQDVPASLVSRNVKDLPSAMPVGSLGQLVQTMVALETNTCKAGVDRAPDDLYATVASGRQTDEAGAMIRFLFGDLCLRAQIQTVLQLMYQQFTSPKLAALSDKNMFDLPYNGTTMVGPGLIVKAQASSPEVLQISVGDVIMVDHGYYQLHSLARVDTLTISMKSETGYVGTFSLRVLDDSLEPYSALTTLISQVHPKP